MDIISFIVVVFAAVLLLCALCVAIVVTNSGLNKLRDDVGVWKENVTRSNLEIYDSVIKISRLETLLDKQREEMRVLRFMNKYGEDGVAVETAMDLFGCRFVTFSYIGHGEIKRVNHHFRGDFNLVKVNETDKKNVWECVGKDKKVVVLLLDREKGTVSDITEIWKEEKND